MILFRVSVAALIGLCAQGAVVAAQGAPVPAEFPPSSYTSNQYVDSQGCAFIRAGIGGSINWLPRINRDRSQLCGFQPTFAAAPPQAPQMTAAPEITVAAAPVPAAPATRVGAPMVTVASTTAPPVLRSASLPQAVSPSPRVMTIPPAVAATVAPSPRVLTRAEICNGKTGVQQGYVSRATGLPIDCGGASAVVAQAATLPEVNGSGQVMTLAQICADAGDSGRRYVSGDTGQEVRCGPQTQPLTTYTVRTAPVYAAPVAPGPSLGRPAVIGSPATPYVPSLTGAGTAYAPSAVPGPGPAPVIVTPQASGVCGNPYMAAPAGMEVRCGPQSQSPSGLVLGSADMAGQAATVTRVAQPVARYGLFRRRVPVSNPAVSVAVPSVPPAGFAPVWNDGRLNANRGLRAPVVYMIQTAASL